MRKARLGAGTKGDHIASGGKKVAHSHGNKIAAWKEEQEKHMKESPAPQSPFTRREEGHLKRIEARCDVLRERLKSAVGSAALDATQELRAIGWAADTVKLLLQEARSETGRTYDVVADAVQEIADAAAEAFRKAGIEPNEWDGDNIVQDVKRGLASDIERLARLRDASLNEIRHVAWHFLESGEERVSDSEVAFDLPNEDYTKLCELVGEGHPEAAPVSAPCVVATKLNELADHLREMAECSHVFSYEREYLIQAADALSERNGT